MTIGNDEQRISGEEAFAHATADEQPEVEATEEERQAAEAEVETEEDAKPDEGEADTEDDEAEEDDGQGRDPATGKFTAKGGAKGIPSGRLRQESEGRRKAEAERDEARRANDDLTRRLGDFERQLTELRNPPRQQRQEEQPADPDPYADPTGFRDAGVKRAVDPIAKQLEDQRLATSEMLARDKFGDETVDQAFTALDEAMRTNPQANRFDHQRIMAARHPYAELVKWHKAQLATKEIGGDPAAYREKLRKELMADPEFVKEVIAAQGERDGDEPAQRGGKGRSTTIELPPSLNGRGGTGGNSGRASPENPRDLLNSFFS
jgi:hypothetical protein